MRIPGRLKGFGRSDSKGKGGSSGKNVDVGALQDERRKVCSSARSSRKASEAKETSREGHDRSNSRDLACHETDRNGCSYGESSFEHGPHGKMERTGIMGCKGGEARRGVEG